MLGKYNTAVLSNKNRKREENSFKIKLDKKYTLTPAEAIAVWEEVVVAIKTNEKYSEFFGKTFSIMALMNLFYQR